MTDPMHLPITTPASPCPDLDLNGPGLEVLHLEAQKAARSTSPTMRDVLVARASIGWADATTSTWRALETRGLVTFHGEDRPTGVTRGYGPTLLGYRVAALVLKPDPQDLTDGLALDGLEPWALYSLAAAGRRWSYGGHGRATRAAGVALELERLADQAVMPQARQALGSSQDQAAPVPSPVQVPVQVSSSPDQGSSTWPTPCPTLGDLVTTADGLTGHVLAVYPVDQVAGDLPLVDVGIGGLEAQDATRVRQYPSDQVRVQTPVPAVPTTSDPGSARLWALDAVLADTWPSRRHGHPVQNRTTSALIGAGLVVRTPTSGLALTPAGAQTYLDHGPSYGLTGDKYLAAQDQARQVLASPASLPADPILDNYGPEGPVVDLTDPTSLQSLVPAEPTSPWTFVLTGRDATTPRGPSPVLASGQADGPNDQGPLTARLEADGHQPNASTYGPGSTCGLIDLDKRQVGSTTAVRFGQHLYRLNVTRPMTPAELLERLDVGEVLEVDGLALTVAHVELVDGPELAHLTLDREDGHQVNLTPAELVNPWSLQDDLAKPEGQPVTFTTAPYGATTSMEGPSGADRVEVRYLTGYGVPSGWSLVATIDNARLAWSAALTAPDRIVAVVPPTSPDDLTTAHLVLEPEDQPEPDQDDQVAELERAAELEDQAAERLDGQGWRAAEHRDQAARYRRQAARIGAQAERWHVVQGRDVLATFDGPTSEADATDYASGLAADDRDGEPLTVVADLPTPEPQGQARVVRNVATRTLDGRLVTWADATTADDQPYRPAYGDLVDVRTGDRGTPNEWHGPGVVRSTSRCAVVSVHWSSPAGIPTGGGQSVGRQNVRPRNVPELDQADQARLASTLAELVEDYPRGLQADQAAELVRQRTGLPVLPYDVDQVGLVPDAWAELDREALTSAVLEVLEADGPGVVLGMGTLAERLVIHPDVRPQAMRHLDVVLAALQADDRVDVRTTTADLVVVRLVQPERIDERPHVLAVQQTLATYASGADHLTLVAATGLDGDLVAQGLQALAGVGQAHVLAGTWHLGPRGSYRPAPVRLADLATGQAFVMADGEPFGQAGQVYVAERVNGADGRRPTTSGARLPLVARVVPVDQEDDQPDTSTTSHDVQEDDTMSTSDDDQPTTYHPGLVGRTGTTRHGEHVRALGPALDPTRVRVVGTTTSHPSGDLEALEAFTPQVRHVQWDGPTPAPDLAELVTLDVRLQDDVLARLPGASPDGRLDHPARIPGLSYGQVDDLVAQGRLVPIGPIARADHPTAPLALPNLAGVPAGAVVLGHLTTRLEGQPERTGQWTGYVVARAWTHQADLVDRGVVDHATWSVGQVRQRWTLDTCPDVGGDPLYLVVNPADVLAPEPGRAVDPDLAAELVREGSRTLDVPGTLDVATRPEAQDPVQSDQSKYVDQAGTLRYVADGAVVFHGPTGTRGPADPEARPASGPQAVHQGQVDVVLGHLGNLAGFVEAYGARDHLVAPFVTDLGPLDPEDLGLVQSLGDDDLEALAELVPNVHADGQDWGALAELDVVDGRAILAVYLDGHGFPCPTCDAYGPGQSCQEEVMGRGWELIDDHGDRGAWPATDYVALMLARAASMVTTAPDPDAGRYLVVETGAVDGDPVLADDLDYPAAVAELNGRAASLERAGWSVTYGWASADNLAAVQAERDGRTVQVAVERQHDDGDDHDEQDQPEPGQDGPELEPAERAADPGEADYLADLAAGDVPTTAELERQHGVHPARLERVASSTPIGARVQERNVPRNVGTLASGILPSDGRPGQLGGHGRARVAWDDGRTTTLEAVRLDVLDQPADLPPRVHVDVRTGPPSLVVQVCGQSPRLAVHDRVMLALGAAMREADTRAWEAGDGRTPAWALVSRYRVTVAVQPASHLAPRVTLEDLAPDGPAGRAILAELERQGQPVLNGTVDTCPSCNGARQVTTAPDDVDACPTCDGHGLVGLEGQA